MFNIVFFFSFLFFEVDGNIYMKQVQFHIGLLDYIWFQSLSFIWNMIDQLCKLSPAHLFLCGCCSKWKWNVENLDWSHPQIIKLGEHIQIFTGAPSSVYVFLSLFLIVVIFCSRLHLSNLFSMFVFRLSYFSVPCISDLQES